MRQQNMGRSGQPPRQGQTGIANFSGRFARKSSGAGSASPPAASLPQDSAQLCVRRDLAYGADPLQKLDIYAPKNKGTALPVLFFVHGGGWSMGDKARHGQNSTAYTDNGVVFASVNYRLAPAVTHPLQIEDIAAAFAWCSAHAAEYGGNPEQIYIMGHSAGAQLVDLLATNDAYLSACKLGLGKIKGVISLDTASLNLVSKGSGRMPEDRMVGKMISAAFGADAATLKDASPSLNIVPGKVYPPFLMFCGEKRPSAIAEQQQFAGALKQAGGKVAVRTVPLGHGDICRASGQRDSSIFQESLEFIKTGVLPAQAASPRISGSGAVSGQAKPATQAEAPSEEVPPKGKMP